MNKLKEFLQSFDNKTGFFAVLLLIVNLLTGVKDAEGQAMISAHAALIMDLIAGILVIGFKAFASGGVLTKGEKLTFYVSQALLVFMQVGQLLQTNDGGLLNEHAVHTIGQLQIWITAAFAALQAWKNNSGGSSGSLATR